MSLMFSFGFAVAQAARHRLLTHRCGRGFDPKSNYVRICGGQRALGQVSSE
jgi:rRNA maturation endonuclease Nob1